MRLALDSLWSLLRFACNGEVTDFTLADAVLVGHYAVVICIISCALKGQLVWSLECDLNYYYCYFAILWLILFICNVIILVEVFSIVILIIL